MNKTNTPQIRFKGFTEAWEQRKLSEAVDVRSGQDYKHLSEGDIPVYGTGGYMLSVDKALSYSEDAIGIGRKGTIDKPFLLHAPFWTVDTLFYAIPRCGYNLEFNYSVFQRIDWKRKDESTGVPSLSKTTINDIEIFVPEFSEQKRIGTFFKEIDNLITLHQRKCEMLQKTKKALLEKMFPQNGSAFPEVRFKGFTETWEQRKLGEISPLRGGFAFQSSKFKNVGIPIAKISNIISDGDVGGDFDYYEELQNDESFVLREGDALLAMSGATTGKVAIVKNTGYTKIYQNQRVGYFENLGKANYSFISTIVRSKFFKQQLYAVLVAGAQPNVSSKDIDSFSFYIPLNMQEQSKLGNFFKQLDNLITLHQRELEKLQKLKSACLQKMFV